MSDNEELGFGADEVDYVEIVGAGYYRVYFKDDNRGSEQFYSSDPLGKEIKNLGVKIVDERGRIVKENAMSTTKEQIEQLKAKIAEAKFAKLTVPSVAFEGKNVDQLTKQFNEAFDADFSIDKAHNKIINLVESNNEFKLFRTLEKFLGTKGVKTNLVEYDVSESKLSHLLENELEKAQVVLAAKDIIDSLQKIAEDLTKIQTESVMPIGDELRMQFGTEVAEKFANIAKSSIDTAFNAVRTAKEQLGDEVAKIQAVMSGEPYPTDISSDEEVNMDEPAVGDLGVDDAIGSEEVNLDAALGGVADEPALGRVKKESRTSSKKAVVESKKK